MGTMDPILANALYLTLKANVMWRGRYPRTRGNDEYMNVEKRIEPFAQFLLAVILRRGFMVHVSSVARTSLITI